MPLLVDLYMGGHLKLEDLIKQEVAFKEIKEVFDAFGPLRSVLRF